MAAPASAQVAIELALQSDHRVRGFSLSDERPVAAVTLAYDDPTGLYVGGTAAGTVRGGGPELVSLQANLGYATRVSPAISIDGGVSRLEYFSPYASARDYHYTEVYLGVATRNIAARVRFSPDYIRQGTKTIYAEIDGGVEIAPNWLVNAHAGVLQYLEGQNPYLPERRYDWRLGVSRLIGLYGVHVDLNGRLGRRNPVPAGAARRDDDRTAIVVSLTRAF